jgi:sugar phosphate permease
LTDDDRPAIAPGSSGETGATSKDEEMRLWRRRILVSTWLAYAGLYFCRKPFYLAKATLGTDLGLSVAELGEAGVAFLICYTVGQYGTAALGHRYGARNLLLTGIAVSIGCNVAFGFANNYWTLMCFMALNGFAQATGWATVVGTLGEWTARKERGTLMGVWGTCYQLGGVAANMWAAFWLARQGTKGAFLAASAVLFGVWFVVYFWQRNRPEDVGLPAVEDDTLEESISPVSPDSSVPSLAVASFPPREFPSSSVSAPDASTDSPWTRALIINIGLIGIFYFGIKFVRYAIWSWAPFFLENNFGMAPDDAGYLSTLFDLAGFAGVVVAGLLSDRLFGGRRALPSFLMLIGMMLGCAALFNFGGDSTLAFGACLTLIGFMLFGPDSLLSGAGAVDIGSPRTAVAAAGIINGTGSLGAVVQELVVSRLYQQTPGDVTPVFATLWAASLFSMAVLAVLLWRNRQGKANI